MSHDLILLVEDEQAIADAIVYALQREHFSVRHCTTAGEALQIWKGLPPALTILDVGLPDLSGFELCKQLRKISDAPVLFLTAQADEIDRVIGFELGADDYLGKPFSPRELLLRVKAILRRYAGTLAQSAQGHSGAGHAALPVVSDEGLCVDDYRACILLRGQTLPLTRSEYLLLAHLLAQPGRVFSREQLLNALGPAAEESSDRAIDTLVKQLRAKLREHQGDEHCIVTHRGLGYSATKASSASGLS